MSDPAFNAFRDKLGDAVTVAINTGKRVSSRDMSASCPLGCSPDFRGRSGFRPFPWKAQQHFPLKENDAAQFIVGFDLGAGVGRYAELGRAYREKFP